MTQGNLAFLSAAVAGIVALFTVGLFKPHLVAEDGLVETMSAVGYGVASLLGLSVALVKRALLSSWEKSLLVGVSAFCLLLALSEISFGARLFDIAMPQMRGGGEFDGGHDIVIVLVRLVSDAGSAGTLLAIVAAAALLAVASVLLWIVRVQVRALSSRLLADPFEFRLALAFVMLAAAVVLDLFGSRELALLEETLEFAASIALIAAIVAIALRTDRPTAYAQRADAEPGGFEAL